MIISLLEYSNFPDIIFEMTMYKWEETMLYYVTSRSVRFYIQIRFYPVGDMITGTKAGDGQYARTDYTGGCVY